MDVTIREGRPDDVASLEILRRQAIEAAFSDAYEREQYADLVATADEHLPEQIDDDRFLVLVATTAVTPVSYAVLDRERAAITAIFTSPDYEREGFGRVLLERTEDDLRSRGETTVSVTTPDVAVRFFEACGFDIAASTEWHGLPGVRLEKRL